MYNDMAGIKGYQTYCNIKIGITITITITF